MEIGLKIKELRLKNQLTQEELADRCELTKGYISQLENDLTSPSITTLKDILQALGSSLTDFFASDEEEKLTFGEDDYFVKQGEDTIVTWLVPTAQKNAMEAIRMEISEGASTEKDLPHEGEEFGYVLDGEVRVTVGKRSEKAKKGESFYYRADKAHYIENTGKCKAVILWLSCPPNF
ncbi:MAG: cupin domain-containing protein [Clostridia bacterium]|nr:cupin domain-containing protein [Clostridia bacterium]